MKSSSVVVGKPERMSSPDSGPKNKDKVTYEKALKGFFEAQSLFSQEITPPVGRSRTTHLLSDYSASTPNDNVQFGGYIEDKGDLSVHVTKKCVCTYDGYTGQTETVRDKNNKPTHTNARRYRDFITVNEQGDVIIRSTRNMRSSPSGKYINSASIPFTHKLKQVTNLIEQADALKRVTHLLNIALREKEMHEIAHKLRGNRVVSDYSA